MDKDSKADEPVEPAAENAPVDLSALDGFDFGTSWSPTTPTSGSTRSRDRGPPRGDRKPRGNQADRKDRRGFKPGNFKTQGGRESDSTDRRPRRSGPSYGPRPGGRPEIPKKVVEVAFYPEDNAFNALCKALKVSTITYELFDIARTILEKHERFYIIIRPDEGQKAGESEEANLYVSESDNLPFLNEESARRHALSDCLEHFFTAETKEVDPPTGSFSSIQKCGFTGELLGPPNYHRLKKIMEDHHSSRLSNMPYAKFESRVESVKEEEVIAEWLEKMKTQTTYSLKAEFGEPRVFEDGPTARAFVAANLSDKMVKPLTNVRVEGTQISAVKDSLIRANLEFAWERQKRFPLDTANLLRGRLRRQKFALYKKGSKGVSFVCAVKRRFRDASQDFSEQVQKLIDFLQANPNISIKDLPEKFLGFLTHAPEGEDQPVLSEDQQKQLKSLNLDFQWLLKEGYIAEYSDGTVFLHNATTPGSLAPDKNVSKSSRKKDVLEKAESVTLSDKENAELEEQAGEEVKSEEKKANAIVKKDSKDEKKESLENAESVTISAKENAELEKQAGEEVKSEEKKAKAVGKEDSEDEKKESLSETVEEVAGENSDPVKEAKVVTEEKKDEKEALEDAVAQSSDDLNKEDSEPELKESAKN